MMPITLIAKYLILEPLVPDIEAAAARLDHHGWAVEITNNFLSDTGDNWCVELAYRDHPDKPKITSVGTTLRRAFAEALWMAADARGEKQWLKHRLQGIPDGAI